MTNWAESCVRDILRKTYFKDRAPLALIMVVVLQEDNILKQSFMTNLIFMVWQKQ